METEKLVLPLAGAAAVLFLTFLWRRYRRPANFPPGPPNLPLLGSVPFVAHELDAITILESCRQKYGNTFSLRTGESWTVVLSDYESIKEACLTRGKEFGGRPVFHIERHRRPCYGETKGIISGDYDDEWKQQRHAGLSVLRDLGYGKSVIEKRILEEAEYVRQAFQAQCGMGPFNPEDHIYNGVTNIILALLVDQRYDYNDPEFQSLRHAVDTSFSQNIEDSKFLPFQRSLPAYKAFVKRARITYNGFIDFLRKHMQKHTSEMNSEASPSCFIDGYLKVLSASEGKMQNWLLPQLEDFVAAGMETTTTTLGWAVYFMVKYPEVQKKVQEELDQVIGSGRKPVVKDRNDLPYTEATLLELLRLATTAPLALPHKTLCDTQIQEYRIPKDSEVLMFPWNVHRNPKTWPEPEVFKPERFLDQQGSVSKPEYLILFGIGRRSCLGEQLARQELFLFFTAMVQSFTLSLPEGATLPPPKGEFAITHRAPKIDICIELR